MYLRERPLNLKGGGGVSVADLEGAGAPRTPLKFVKNMLYNVN